MPNFPSSKKRTHFQGVLAGAPKGTEFPRVEGPLEVLFSAGAASAGAVNATGKSFAAGTYIGIGGATAPITSTGLTRISHVFMSRTRSAYSTATAAAISVPCPCLAAGTPGSFYPIVFRDLGGGAQPSVAAVSATWKWFAVGAR